MELEYRIFKNRDILSPLYVPETLHHREKEAKEILGYIGHILEQRTPPHLLIFGPTGSGKTVTFQKIIKDLKQRAKHEFKVGYTVGANSGFQALVTLARDLGLYTIRSSGISLMEVWDRLKRFIGDIHTLLVIDEIDKMMASGGNDLLYFLSRQPKISIIGISNKIQFLDMINDARVKSSFTPRKIVFPPYNALQLQDIIRDRVPLTFYANTLDPEIIPKTAAVASKRNGDARYALDLLTMAGDIAEREGARKITIEHFNLAKEEVDCEFIRKSILLLRETQQVLLYCISVKGVTTPRELYHLYNRIADNIYCEKLKERRLAEYLKELSFYGYINILRKGRGRGRGVDWQLEISDTIEKDLLIEALKKTELNKFIEYRKIRSLDSYTEQPEKSTTTHKEGESL